MDDTRSSEQICGEMGGKEAQSGESAVERQNEDTMDMKTRLMECPQLPQRAMFGSAALRQPESVLMSHGPCYHQRPSRYLWSELPPEAMVTSGPEWQQKPMSGFMDLSKLGSVLMSVACVTTKGHMDAIVWTVTQSYVDV